MRLDMRLLPLARMMYSSLRRISLTTVPSRERAWPSSSRGFIRVMLQHRKTEVKMDAHDQVHISGSRVWT